MHYLYRHLISNEETYINYLILRNLLSELGSCFKLKGGVISGGTLKQYQTNNRKRASNGHILKTSLRYQKKKKFIKHITL